MRPSVAELFLKRALPKASLPDDQSAERLEEQREEPLVTMSPSELAELFVTVSFFRCTLQPLIDQDWIRHQQADLSAVDPRVLQMTNELLSLDFLHDELIGASAKTLKNYIARSNQLLKLIVSFVKLKEADRYQAFVQAAMSLIDVRARYQDSLPHNHFSEALYRAFDQLDDILGIHYDLDVDMASDPNQKERLYEGAGIGVQTSYSSILLALDRAKPVPGARILDLGSGYGRVGFVLGLLRPDINFTGYEYVDHRVEDSKAVARRAGLSRTAFVTQDLARADFRIPEADIYYMYDPFSRETYGTVLNQLIAIGKRFPVTIITKGRANTWVREALELQKWSIDDTCDSGTVCLFRS